MSSPYHRGPRFVQTPPKQPPRDTKQTAQIVFVALLIFYAVGVVAQRVST